MCAARLLSVSPKFASKSVRNGWKSVKRGEEVSTRGTNQVWALSYHQCADEPDLSKVIKIASGLKAINKADLVDEAS